MKLDCLSQSDFTAALFGENVILKGIIQSGIQINARNIHCYKKNFGRKLLRDSG